MTEQAQTQPADIRAEDLTVEQLDQITGGASHGSGAGGGKVSMNDFHFVLGGATYAA